MIFAGCDIGSTTGKAVLLDEKGAILSSAVIPSTFDPEKTALEVLAMAGKNIKSAASIDDIDYIIGTGYGRIEISFAHENISEITCHGVGAHFLDSRIRTVVDIGGQDCKAILLRDDGRVLDFVMNDKCAAGTGRFFEGVGRAFGLGLEDFSELSLKSGNPLPISSQCSVFAESEIISLISQRKNPADIAAGIQDSVAKRIHALLRRVGLKEKFTITGGCAKNRGLVRMLEKRINTEIISLKEDPQLIGALGAAVLAMENKK